MSKADSTLINEILEIAENKAQLEQLLKTLPGVEYSEEELQQIYNNLKEQAFQDYQNLTSSVEINRTNINLKIDNLELKINQLSDLEGQYKTKDGELKDLLTNRNGLINEKNSLLSAQNESNQFFQGEINQVQNKINSANSSYNYNSILIGNPVEHIVQSPTEIQSIINDFTNAKNHAQERVILWQERRDTPNDGHGATKSQKKMDIFNDFIDKFNTAITQLNSLKTYSQSNDNYVNSGVTPHQVDSYINNLESIDQVYQDLITSYDNIKTKIANQREKWENGNYDNSINVKDHINKYLGYGQGEILVYQVDAEVSAENLNNETYQNIRDLKENATNARNDLINGYNVEINLLNNSKNVANGNYQTQINNLDFEIQQVNGNISSKEEEIKSLEDNYLNPITEEINTLYNDYSQLLSDNEGLVQKWKLLLRNESHYFLDESELVLYEEIYTDLEEHLEGEGNFTGVKEFLETIQSANSDRLVNILTTTQEYTKQLEQDINWAKDRQVSIELIGASSKEALDELVSLIDGFVNDNLISQLPLNHFSENLKEIQIEQNNLLTSYDDLEEKIQEVKSWIQDAKSLENNTLNSLDEQILNDYLVQLEVTEERLSLFPATLNEIQGTNDEFNQKVSEVELEWDNVLTPFNTLVNVGIEKKSKFQDLITQESNLNSLKAEKIEKETEKTARQEQNIFYSNEINQLTGKINSKQNELDSANASELVYQNNVNLAQERVDEIRNRDGGFFQWIGSELVRRPQRIANYREAVADLFDAQEILNSQILLINTLENEKQALEDTKKGFQQEINHNNSRINSLNSEIASFSSHIVNTEITINNLENDIETLNAQINDRASAFLSEFISSNLQFLDLESLINAQYSSGEKLLSLGLLITESDIDFFENEVNPAVNLFKEEISDRDHEFQGLNSSLETLQNQVNSVNSNNLDLLVAQFVEDFQAKLSQQNIGIDELILEYNEFIPEFENSYQQAENEIEEILISTRISAYDELENNKEIFEILQTTAIAETFLDNIIDRGNLYSAPLLESNLRNLIEADVLRQEEILKDADAFNQKIDGDIGELKQLASDLIEDFDLSLTKTLGDYLKERGDLTQELDIEQVLTERLSRIDDAVTSVRDSIALFQQKINSQDELTAKIEGISNQLKLSETAQEFLEIQNLLDKQNLTSENLNEGITKLQTLVEEIQQKGGNINPNILQTLEQLNTLQAELATFEENITLNEEKLLNLTEDEVKLLEKAELYDALGKIRTPEQIQELIDKGVDNNLGNLYFVSPEAGTWEEIQEFAESIGGSLVVINGQKEQNYLQQIFGKTPEGKPNRGAKFWIGVTDKFQEGRFTTADNESLSFRNWRELSNSGKRDYAYMNRHGLWKTAGNNGRQGEKLHGIIELNFHDLTIKRSQLEAEENQLRANLTTTLEESQDYQIITDTLGTVKTALEDLLTGAGIGDLNILSVVGTIRDNYQQSSQELANLENQLKMREASAKAHFEAAEFYESAALEYLEQHNQLKHKFANKLGVEVPDSLTWTETRESWTRSLFGKSEIPVEITHLNTYWLYYENFSKQAETSRDLGYEILGREDLNEENPEATVGNTLKDEFLTAKQINDAWEIANSQADVLEDRLSQLGDLIETINVAGQQSAEYQQAIDNLTTLLPDLENQLTQATVDAERAFDEVRIQWQTYYYSAETLQQTYDELIPIKSQYLAENNQILSNIENTREWVSLRNQSLGIQLESITEQKERLEEFLDSNGEIDSTTRSILENSLDLLSHDMSILENRQKALREYDEAIVAQKDLLLTEAQLIETYFDNGGTEYSLLRQQLDTAQSTLNELELLAESALDSNTILTNNINSFAVYLDSLNDEHLGVVRESQETLEALIENLELKTSLFESAKSSIDSINEIEPETIDLLEKMIDAGETRAEELLDLARVRGLAVAARIYRDDFLDLTSDTGNFFTGGIGTEEDKKLARYFNKLLRENRALRREAARNASQSEIAFNHAEAQKTLIDAEINQAQSEYDNLLAQIGSLDNATETQREKLDQLEARQITLEILQGTTENIISQIFQVQLLNSEIAQLEIDYADNLKLDETLAQQKALEALALDYQRQQLATQIEIYQKQDVQSALQQSLIEVGRDIGLEIEPILENTDHSTAIANLQAQLAEFNLNPDVPEDLKQKINNTQITIDRALEGEEEAEIEAQLTEIVDGLIGQNNQYQTQLDELKLAALEDQNLLEESETNLQQAVNELLTAIETRNDYLEDKSILSDELLGVLEQVRQAQDANQISQGLAQEARSIFNDILEQRQIEREARQKTFFDFFLESNATLLSIASVVVTAGSSLGLIASVEKIKAGLRIANAINSAITSAYNGDWTDAIFNAVKGITSYIGTLELPDNVLEGIKDFQSLADSAYDALRKAQSGDELGGFLGRIRDLSSFAFDSFGEYIKPDDISNELFEKIKKFPDFVFDSIEAIENGDWLGASSNIFNGVISLSQMRGIDSVESGKFASLVETIDAIGDIGFTIGNAIQQGDLNTWISTIDSVFQRHEFYDKSQQLIARQINLISGFQPTQTNTISTDSGEKEITFLALNGQIDSSKPTYVIVAGFLTNSSSDWLRDTSLLLQKNVAPDANYLIVDWSDLNGSSFYPFNEAFYDGAARNTQIAGEALGNYLNQLNIPSDQLHLIGHSLGAHVVGVAGRVINDITGSKVNEIIGLDPAAPAFDSTFPLTGLEITDLGNKLDVSDAQLVKVIHSNYEKDGLFQDLVTGHLGSNKYLGDVDIFLESSQNDFYLKDSHGDSIQFFQHFLLHQSDYNGDIEAFNDDLLNNRILNDAGFTETFNDYRDGVNKIVDQFYDNHPDLEIEYLPQSQTETFTLDINYQTDSFSYENSSSKLDFSIQQVTNTEGQYFEIIPQTNNSYNQFLEISDFDSSLFELETSLDNGVNWKKINTFDFDSKLQTLWGNRSYRITPKTETGEVNLNLRLIEIPNSEDNQVEEVEIFNNPPVANDDSFTTTENTPLIISTGDLLANDVDIDRDTISLIEVHNPINGMVTLDGNGNAIFIPLSNFNGEGSFEYTIADGNDGSDTAMATVSINPNQNLDLDLVVTSFDVVSDNVIGGEASVSFSIENQNLATSPDVEIAIVYSDNEIIGDVDDLIIDSYSLNSLEGGESLQQYLDIQLPINLLETRVNIEDPLNQGAGYVSRHTDYLGVVIDPDQLLNNEVNRDNNSNQGKGIDLDDITYFPWDLDNDGFVTSLDAMSVINILGQTVSPSNERADFDGDGFITSIDTISIINRLGYSINNSVIENI